MSEARSAHSSHRVQPPLGSIHLGSRPLCVPSSTKSRFMSQALRRSSNSCSVVVRWTHLCLTAPLGGVAIQLALGSARSPSPFCLMTVPSSGTSIMVLRLMCARLLCHVSAARRPPLATSARASKFGCSWSFFENESQPMHWCHGAVEPSVATLATNLSICNCLTGMMNDLARAMRRWTEKNLAHWGGWMGYLRWVLSPSIEEIKPMEIEAKQYNKRALASCQTVGVVSQLLNGSLCCYKTCKAIIERYSNKLMLILSFSSGHGDHHPI